MGETFDAFFQADENTERCNLSHGSLDDHLGGEAVSQGRPGIWLAAPDAEGDFLLHAVEGKDVDINLGAGLEDFAGTRYAAPGEFGDVGEAIGAAEVDEGAKAGQVADATFANLADLEFVEELLPAFGSQFPFRGPLGEDEAVATPVHLDDLELQGLVD